jgi:hypothetical protein
MNRAIVPIAAALVLGAAGSAGAQTGTMYIHGGYSDGPVSAVQGGVLQNQWSGNNGNFAPVIAVNGTIRFSGYTNGVTGYEYDLAGNPTGNTFTQTVNDYLFYDGASDGQHNYSIGYNTGQVYQFDANWGNPTPIFGGLPTSVPTGISWDSNNSLWIYTANDSTVRNYSMGGSLLSSFPAANPGTYSKGVAFDYTDQTIWLTDYGNGDSLSQYDRNGNHLQTIFVNGLYGSSALTAEFDVRGIPAPASAALLGLGGLAASRRRRA